MYASYGYAMDWNMAENLKKIILESIQQFYVLDAHAKEKSATATKAAFSADSEDLDEALVKTADKLEWNGFTEVIDTESVYYVVQVTSLFDQKATDAKEAELIEERKEEFYTETVDKWTEDTEIKVYDKVWKQITIEGLKVNAIEPEAEEDTTEGTTESTTEGLTEGTTEEVAG